MKERLGIPKLIQHPQSAVSQQGFWETFNSQYRTQMEKLELEKSKAKADQ